MGSDPRPATSTAYRHWDAVWRTDEARSTWSDADPWVAETVESLDRSAVRTVLDLGCGVGRHAVLLAKTGFDCRALDLSESGVAGARELARRAGVRVDFAVGGMHDLPYETASFDYVLAFNVVYHGDEPAVARTLAEVRRVIRPGGRYQSTMLSKRNAEHGRGVEVSPNTFVQPDAGDDKVHPHLYCDAHDLLRLHSGMDLVSAVDRVQQAPGSFHWHCVFEASR